MWFRFPISVPGGLPGCRAAFAASGVSVRRGVDALVHHVLELDDRAFPLACELFETTVSLPLYPALTGDDIERVLAATRLVLGSDAPRDTQCA
jgi:dTDP-4-amino-4,6-dideoxygalactose transaminase